MNRQTSFLAIVFTLLAGCLCSLNTLGAQTAPKSLARARLDAGATSTHQSQEWDLASACAGEAKYGLRAVTRLSRSPVAAGEAFGLQFELKNVCEVPCRYSVDRFEGIASLIIARSGRQARETDGGPIAAHVRWTGKLSYRNAVPRRFGHRVPAVKRDFDFHKPGRYTVLAGLGGCGSDWVVASPLIFTLDAKSAA